MDVKAEALWETVYRDNLLNVDCIGCKVGKCIITSTKTCCY